MKILWKERDLRLEDWERGVVGWDWKGCEFCRGYQVAHGNHAEFYRCSESHSRGSRRGVLKDMLVLLFQEYPLLHGCLWRIGGTRASGPLSK